MESNDYFYRNALAPIAGNILLWRGSPQKICWKAGNSFK